MSKETLSFVIPPPKNYKISSAFSYNFKSAGTAGYRKTFEQDISSELGLGIDISVRIKPVWEVLPKRWIVERSLAWINNSRCLSKDYEISVCSAQAVCTIAASRTLLKRF